MKYFLDTGAFFAYFIEKDPAHPAMLTRVQELIREGHSLLYTDYVFSELLTLVRVRAGSAVSANVGKGVSESEYFTLHNITLADRARAWEIFSTQLDKDYSFTDCTSFAIMERLGVQNALATDRHFTQYGFQSFPDPVRGK